MFEREQLRHKLRSRHNDQMMLEQKCGVRLGSLKHKNQSPTEKIDAFSDKNPEILITEAVESGLGENESTSCKDTFSSKMATMRFLIPTNQQRNENFQFKFISPKGPKMENQRDFILALPKPEYQGKDFFWRSEFRGLILADYQEAVGSRAFTCVEEINKSTVN